MVEHRILHSSDWHLGVSTGTVSRLQEQRLFFEWLRDTLTSEQIDTLVVAGDIFDTMQPSAEAQSVYYRFLAQVGDTGIRQVVIVGGNHDSPTRLDASGPILGALSVHVVGGYTVPGRMVIPLYSRGSDEVTAVCLAVPYMHEYRLGVRTTLVDPSDAKKQFKDAFGGLYRDLVDKAESEYPGVPVIATGHLTLGSKVDKDDYPQEIHQVGTIDAMSTDIIDPRIVYTALGHIHRSFPVQKDRGIWYSGTPVPYSLKESESQRVVLSVTLGAELDVKALPVPLRRTLVEVRGTRDVVVERLRSLQWEEDLPPLVHVFVETDHVEVSLTHSLHEALLEHPESARPALVEVKQGRSTEAIEAELSETQSFNLAELTTTEVFQLLCQSEGKSEEAAERLTQSFELVRLADHAALQALIPESKRVSARITEAEVSA
jgi:exonuclease SbcD